MRKYGKVFVGMVYGILPVLLALALLHSLGALATVVGNLLGLEKPLIRQISQALQQLQEAKVVMPWLAGLALGVLSSLVLLIVKERKIYGLLIIIGVVLLLPLTLGAFCLASINDVQVWRELIALAQWL